MPAPFLSADAFLAVIANTPLVSIDLIVRDAAGAMLVGRRVNAPARGSWFVPGGRILKDETLEQAFARISEAELGCRRALADARLLGAFTHKYADNALGAPGVTTHYVVLAYVLFADPAQVSALSQHSSVRWITQAQLASDSALAHDVHDNVLPYFE